MDKIKKIIIQFIRFGIVGGVNTGVDFLVLNGLVWITGVGTESWLVIVFKVISFLAAATNSYFLNKYWAFKQGGEVDVKEVGSFFVVSVIGFFVNVGIFAVVSHMTPIFGLHPTAWLNFANLMATAGSLVWNFIGYKIFVFKK